MNQIQASVAQKENLKPPFESPFELFLSTVNMKTEAELKKMKVAELRTLLEEANLNPSGLA